MSTAAPAPGPLGRFSALNGTMSEWQKRAETNPVVDFVDHCLRGVGQVCFMNNPVTGARGAGARVPTGCPEGAVVGPDNKHMVREGVAGS